MKEIHSHLTKNMNNIIFKLNHTPTTDFLSLTVKNKEKTLYHEKIATVDPLYSTCTLFEFGSWELEDTYSDMYNQYNQYDQWDLYKGFPLTKKIFIEKLAIGIKNFIKEKKHPYITCLGKYQKIELSVLQKAGFEPIKKYKGHGGIISVFLF
jgi:hypothetical protein